MRPRRTVRDHPRIRGEHLPRRFRVNLIAGIIPAYAGNTWRGRPCTSRSRGSSPHTRGTLRTSRRPKMTRRDHPRMRGEHAEGAVRRGGRGGIIPACAGNTATFDKSRSSVMGSSPHARGTLFQKASRRCRGGDHPRMRGEHVLPPHAVLAVVGIIPACAGNTTPLGQWPRPMPGSSPHARGTPNRHQSLSTRSRDHPRMRGEHRRRHGRRRPPEGIIPACAGNTKHSDQYGAFIEGSSPHARGTRRCRRSTGFSKRDHPRMRGEHEHDDQQVRAEDGIIPACAGNTRTPGLVKTPMTGSSPHARGTQSVTPEGALTGEDHPRMRGEHSEQPSGVNLQFGIIPACAGNTLS